MVVARIALDDGVDSLLWHAHHGVVVADPDGPDLTAGQVGLVSDRPDKVTRPHPGLAAETDIDESGAGPDIALRLLPALALWSPFGPVALP